MSTAFDFMTMWQFNDWWGRTRYRYLNWFDYEEEKKFSLFGGSGDEKKHSINYRGYVTFLDSIFFDFASEAAGENIISILENGDGSIPRWDYESLCEFIDEPPYLLLPQGELKYFWGRKAAACPAHIDRLFSALRYKVLETGNGGRNMTLAIRISDVSPKNWDQSLSAAQEYINEEFTNSWEANSWEDSYGGIIYQKHSSASFYYDNLPGPNSIDASASVYRYKMQVNQRFSGRDYLYGVPQKLFQDESDEKYGRVIVHTTGGLYQNLPKVPEWGKWYKLYDHEFRESTSADDIQVAYWGYDKMPTPTPIIAYSSDQENKETSYSEGFKMDQIAEIYDIHPDQPTTFLP